jgi:uncharacterized damage-inducible protein DinB
MLSTQSLRDQMNRYVEGSLSSEALEEWLASESWEMRRWVSPGLQHLVEALQGAFIRHSDGELSAADLDKFLKERRQQLQRAAEANRAVEEYFRASLPKQDESRAVNQALTVLDSVLATA